MSATKLVANLRSPTLSQKYFDDASVVVIVGDHHFVHITRLNAAFEPTRNHTSHSQSTKRFILFHCYHSVAICYEPTALSLHLSEAQFIHVYAALIIYGSVHFLFIRHCYLHLLNPLKQSHETCSIISSLYTAVLSSTRLHSMDSHSDGHWQNIIELKT